MEIIAHSQNVRITPRKARAVAVMVKSLSISQASQRLEFLAKKGAKPMALILKSAIANAVTNFKLKAEDLKIKNIIVDEGMKMKRRDTSHRPGREGLIQKRTSHIKVILESS